VLAVPGTVNVAVVRLLSKVTKVPEEVFVITTLVPVFTLPLNVAPPELVIVSVDKEVVPIAPLTLIVPEEPLLMVNAWVLALVPLTVLLKLMALPVELAPVEARFTELPRVTAPV
jgi:hypothetical protein